jgi:hypothetical protein
VNVYQRRILEEESRQEALRLIAGLVLLSLLIGIWTCLWVPQLVR